MSSVQTNTPVKRSRQTAQSTSQEDQQRLFDALDILQKQRSEAAVMTNAVLDASTREAQMLDSLRQLHRSRGETVNEEELMAAVRATREPTNLVYRRTEKGLGASLSSAYLARNKWFPHSMGVLAIMVATWGGVQWRAHAIEQSFQQSIATNATTLANLKTQIKTLDAEGKNWPQGLGQNVHKAAFDQALSAAAAAANATELALQSPTKDEIVSIEKSIEQSTVAIGAAQNARDNAATQLDLVAKAQQIKNLPEDAAWPQINERRRAKLAELNGALAVGDITQARAVFSDIGTLSTASAVRSTLREAAALVPQEGQSEALALRTKGESALLNADIKGANAALAALKQLTDVFTLSYTMKIVNEQGVQSGVWRYPNDNRSARNYYVVVDALDAAGNPVQVSVVNEETGKTEKVSRFAVRVSEKAYEAVKSDKMDNGLIDNAFVGNKQAGVLRPSYQIETAGGAGIITEW